jgi:hypothetical protein
MAKDLKDMFCPNRTEMPLRLACPSCVECSRQLQASGGTTLIVAMRLAYRSAT